MQHKDETTPRSSFRQYSPLLLALLFCPLVNILRMPTSDACDQAISTQIRSDSIVGDDLFLGFPTTADDVVRRNRLPSTTQEIVYIGDHVKSAVDAIAQSINKVNHVHDSMNEDSFRQLSSQAAYQQSLLNDAELLAPMDYEPLRSNGVDHFHRLPLRKYGVSSHQISSRDTNYNNQDFSHFITVKDNTLTLFEDFGSGCIERIYLAYTAYAHRRSMEQWVMSITVDGQIVFKEQVRMIGSTFKNPFIYPLSGTTESQNGFYLYNPIFYKKHCLITVKTVKNHYPKDKDPRTLYALGFYHIFSFQKFHFDVSKDTTPTYQGVSENITSHLELASKYLYGSFKDKPAPLTRLTKHQTYAGQQIIDQQSKEFILAEHKGSGAIVGLYMNIIDGTKEHFESFVVELKFDSLEDMKTSVPFGMLFGSEHGKYETRSVTVGFTPGKGGYILFPMPFWSGFRVSIITQPNASMKLPVAVSFQFDFTHSVYPKERTGYFRANYHADRDMGPYMFPMLVVPHGWGHIVGLYMVMKRNNSLTRELGSPFEGNDFSFIDGSKSPQVPGTGTEDFFNVAHFFRDWNSTSHMFHGNPHFEYEDHKVYHAAAYRILLSDYIIYRKSIKFLMEHGPGTFSAPRADYASVVYHYQGIGHGLVNTDLLTPRDEKSAKDHSYTYEGPTKASEMNLDLVKEKWGPPYANPPQSPHGYIYAGGVIQFDVKIQPENKGVLLRRVLDYKHQNQMAEVYVDGKLAVTWYTPKFSQKFRISESEVWLPKELTQGKSSLHVKLDIKYDAPGTEEGQHGKWTEFEYSIFCETEATNK
eukprot:TRINITY_DN7943_c0_g1_i1.p1 TRINITY_DN7943_c0_g1~~TRINITY_DN7943_c0_g1_i1.p1  ORF type:complete len:812 (-),score=128.33 TRINITY_DN7943_c0_g1_i1:145-2580(-)